MARELFLISTKAGAYEKNLPKKIQCFFPNAEIVETKYPDHLTEIVDEFSKRKISNKRLYLLGGDGSLNEACSILQGTDTALGLIPYGTCNDFAKTLYSHQFSLEEYLEGLSDLQQFPLDLIQHNHGVSINILSAGIDSMVLQNAYNILKYFPRLKSLAYVLSAIYTIFRYPGIEIHWEGDHGVGDDVVKLVALCNGRSYGGGFTPAPDANPMDGTLEFCYVKDCSPFALIPKMIKYRKGIHLEDPAFRKIKTKKGKIQFKESVIGNFDGTIFNTRTIEYEVLPKKILFVAPRQFVKTSLHP
ncbi:MAG: diacylglycerol kinase family protein [Tissierellia bacterium]|nr:diacylglycerol kinase family protein [Tissierellia bacterium]